MALVTRASSAQMDVSTGQFAPQISGLVAGEDLDLSLIHISEPTRPY